MKEIGSKMKLSYANYSFHDYVKLSSEIKEIVFVRKLLSDSNIPSLSSKHIKFPLYLFVIRKKRCVEVMYTNKKYSWSEAILGTEVDYP